MSDQPAKCRNCRCEQSSRRPFKRTHCCGRCFYLLEYLKDVEQWDLKRHETLKRISTMENPYGGKPLPYIHGMSEQDFAIFKTNYIEQLKAKLNRLRVREAKRCGNDPVTGHTIEQKFKDVLKLVRLRDKYHRARTKFHGIATTVDRNFNREQRRLLYSFLDDIEDLAYVRLADRR